jgi:DNA-binding GntR family transcriptional regulator
MALESLRSAAASARGGHRTLAEKSFAALHEAIVTGVLEPGERLPIEDLAEAFDMSPMPIREALRRLDSVGLVENIPHRGARVTELSIGDLIDVYEARLSLEPLAIQRAAERFTEDDERAARQALTRHIAAIKQRDIKEVWMSHTDFHFALYEAGGSRWLTRLIMPLWESSERYRFASRPIQRRLATRRGEHERILDACVRHAPAEAARELHNHLARTANAVAESMGNDTLFELKEKGAVHPPRPMVRPSGNGGRSRSARSARA